MLVSARGAAEILRAAGLTRDEARHLLLAGFAGPGRRTPGALLYDEERVGGLATWPQIEDETVDERVLIIGRIERFGPMPFLATVCDYVAFGADIVALEVGRDGKTTFTLTEASSWFEGFDQRCLLAGADRSCFIWGWPPQYRE